MANLDLVWTCQCCGKQYSTLPLAFALDEPDPWRALPDEERMARGVFSTDGCVIDRKQFCVRARMEIPVVGVAQPFVWGIWASVSEQDFERIGKLWYVEAREHEPPIAAALCSDIPIYPATTDLACSLHLQNAGRRPSIRLAATDHPLAVEQRDGITIERVMEIAAAVQQHSRPHAAAGRL